MHKIKSRQRFGGGTMSDESSSDSDNDWNELRARLFGRKRRVDAPRKVAIFKPYRVTGEPSVRCIDRSIQPDYFDAIIKRADEAIAKINKIKEAAAARKTGAGTNAKPHIPTEVFIVKINSSKKSKRFISMPCEKTKRAAALAPGEVSTKIRRVEHPCQKFKRVEKPCKHTESTAALAPDVLAIKIKRIDYYGSKKRVETIAKKLVVVPRGEISPSHPLNDFHYKGTPLPLLLKALDDFCENRPQDVNTPFKFDGDGNDSIFNLEQIKKEIEAIRDANKTIKVEDEMEQKEPSE